MLFQVPLLKAHLRGKVVRGEEWRPGSKKREALLQDFRCLLLYPPAHY